MSLIPEGCDAYGEFLDTIQSSWRICVPLFELIQLSDRLAEILIGMNVAILAIAVPVFLQVVSNFSSKYGSRATKRIVFVRAVDLRYLSVGLVLTIICLLITQYFKLNHESLYYGVLYLSIFAVCLAILVNTVILIFSTFKWLDPERTLESLLREADHILKMHRKNDKRHIYTENNFEAKIDTAMDIIEVEVSSGMKSQFVIELTDKLANLSIVSQSDRVVRQIVNILRRSYSSRDKELFYMISRSIEAFAIRLSKERCNNVKLKTLFDELDDLFIEFLVSGDSFALGIPFDIYLDIVCYPNSQFDIKNLSVINDFLSKISRHIIVKSRTELYCEIYEYLLHSFRITYFGLTEAESLIDSKIAIIGTSEDHCKTLMSLWKDTSSRVRQGKSMKDFEEFCVFFEDFRNDKTIKAIFDDQELDQLQGFLFNAFRERIILEGLRRVAFEICAFSLYRRNLDFLVRFWRYEDPDQTEIFRLPSDITLRSANEVLDVYFLSNHYIGSAIFWERNVMARRYFRSYFILLLLRCFRKEERIEPRLPSLKRAKLDILEQINSSEIEKVNQQICEVVKEKTLLESLDLSEVSEEMINRVHRYLEKFLEAVEKEKTERQLTGSVDDKRIEEFKDNIRSSYSENSLVGHLSETLKSGGREENWLEMPLETVLTAEVGREVFIEEYSRDSRGISSYIGRNLAFRENRLLIEIMAARCTELGFDTFCNEVERIGNNVDLIALVVVKEPLWSIEKESNKIIVNRKERTLTINNSELRLFDCVTSGVKPYLLVVKTDSIWFPADAQQSITIKYYEPEPKVSPKLKLDTSVSSRIFTLPSEIGYRLDSF